MPFKSEKQRKWMHANDPDMADEWEKKKKTEAFRPSDRKVLMVIGRDIIRGLNKNYHKGTLTPNKQLGQALNSIFRAMTRPKDDANYKQYKKYFPKYNHKLLNRLAKAYFDQPVNVQNTFIKQVMDYSLKESLEEAKRDYKDEYKKFQSSTKAKKYRAELNKYNRKKGTYGNGDGKDASHKGGKIVGFESQSKNRGRAEKSRLKKEAVLNENPAVIATAARMAVQNAQGKKVSVNTARQSSYASKDPSAHKKAKSIFQRIKDKFKKKDDKPKKKSAPTTAADFRRRRNESVNESVYKFRGMTKTDMDEFDAQLSRDNVKGTPDFNKMTYTIHSPKKSVYLDYYIKTKYKKFKPKRIREGFGGDLKGAEKKKFEKARKENAEVLGYKVTGKSDIREANNIDKIKDIVKKKQYKRIGGVIIDMQTANAILQVYKALNLPNRKKYGQLSISKMADVAYKLIK